MQFRFLSLLVIGGATLGSTFASTFTSSATATISFTSSSANFTVADTPSTSLDIQGTGDAIGVVTTGSYGSGPYYLVSSAYGSVTNGDVSGAATATHQFILKNLGSTAISFTLGLDYSLSAQGTGGGFSEAGLQAIGGLTGVGNDQIFSNNTSSLTGGSYTYSLLPHQISALTFTATAEGYASAVPEPTSMAVLGLGMVGILARRRRASK